MSVSATSDELADSQYNLSTEQAEPNSRNLSPLLLGSILVVSSCAIVYELLISTLSSYLLGNSVLHFSVTIGLFMFFMGVGSFLSRFIQNRLLEKFIAIEITIGLCGGFSGLLLYLTYSMTEYYYLVAFLVIASISTLVGLEIPIVARIIRRYAPLKEAIADTLAFDYIGALIASLVFPLVCVPYLGLMRTSFLVGLINISVALVTLCYLRNEIKDLKFWKYLSISGTAVLILGFWYSLDLVGHFEQYLYQDQVIFSSDSPYQRIILTKHENDLRLYLSGNLQFSSIDEHRYHEPLTHIPLALVPIPEQVLILGGGDGLAAREILKDERVKQITLVDLDAEMIELAKNNSLVSNINSNSLKNPKLKVVIQDAYRFIEESAELFSVIIVDLPDPNDLSLGKLYSKEFYQLLAKRLTPDGVAVTQSSSPYLARKAFWSINNTIKESFTHVVPYWSYIPSFGPWGFNLMAHRPIPPEKIELKTSGKYLKQELIPTLFIFDRDMERIDAEVNRLDNQVLVQYYEESLD